MVLHKLCALNEVPTPLRLETLPEPMPVANEVLIEVTACAVCHTELDEIEGRLPPARLPIVLGHQVVGHIRACGENVDADRIGQRVGVAWVFSACGACDHCRRGEENLCADFRGTGRDVNGGYAEYMIAPAAYAHPLPTAFNDSEAAPLLCAGAIGYRSLRLTGLQDGQRLGLTGFGASAHLVLKTTRHRFPNSPVFVFARNPAERAFALEIGATWPATLPTAPPNPSMLSSTPPRSGNRWWRR